MNCKSVFRTALSIVTIALIGCGETLVGTSGVARAAGKKPNVIIVITDDQGYGDLACHGNTVIKTPNLDRLHSMSVRLTDFHVGPTCSPTRAGLMSGRYCNSTGVWHTISGRSLIRRDEVVMGQIFADSGYRTAMFGKWHLGDNYPFRPEDRGFQEVLRHGGGGVGQTPDYWNNDYFTDTYWHNKVAVKKEGYCTDVWFDGAIEFIRKNKDRPFFAYLSTNAPHGPFRVANKYVNMYKGNSKVPNVPFYGMITNIDDNMGRLMKELDVLGIADNTMLIFMTDNGTAGGIKGNKGFNAGMRGKKGSQYDGGHRVPFFIRWPEGGLEGGVDVTRLTAHVDVIPTLMELCGLTRRDGPPLHGRSIVPLLKGNDAGWPDRAIVTDSQRIEMPQKWRRCSVMTDKWRLVDGKELYDIKSDPGQKSNIASQNQAVVGRLRGEYEKWWTMVSKRFNEYCPIVVGTEHESPAAITAHDWHGGKTPWNQGAIRSGPNAAGFWVIDVAMAGRYEVALRRYPVEADAAIAGTVPIGDVLPDGKKAYGAGKPIKVTKARLKIGSYDQTKPIRSGAKEVVFTADLPAGETKMEAWFLGSGKKGTWGAFYVYVSRTQ